MIACLLTQLSVPVGTPVQLIRKCSKQAIAVSGGVRGVQMHTLELLVQVTLDLLRVAQGIGVFASAASCHPFIYGRASG